MRYSKIDIFKDDIQELSKRILRYASLSTTTNEDKNFEMSTVG